MQALRPRLTDEQWGGLQAYRDPRQRLAQAARFVGRYSELDNALLAASAALENEDAPEDLLRRTTDLLVSLRPEWRETAQAAATPREALMEVAAQANADLASGALDPADPRWKDVTARDLAARLQGARGAAEDARIADLAVEALVEALPEADRAAYDALATPEDRAQWLDMRLRDPGAALNADLAVGRHIARDGIDAPEVMLAATLGRLKDRFAGAWALSGGDAAEGSPKARLAALVAEIDKDEANRRFLDAFAADNAATDSRDADYAEMPTAVEAAMRPVGMGGLSDEDALAPEEEAPAAAPEAPAPQSVQQEPAVVAENATTTPGPEPAPVLSGDEVRKTMPGYNPADWRTHVDRSGYVGPRMEARFRELLATRKGKGNGSVVFLAGGNGAGKSTFAAKLGGTPDFTIDSTLGNLDVARRQIEAVLANGQKPVIAFVYRTPEQALEGIQARVDAGGHAVSPLSFANSHTQSIRNLGLLAREYGDRVDIAIFDNSVPGAPEITLQQLEAKGIPAHEDIRKRANEVLGPYGSGLAAQGGAGSVPGGGGTGQGPEGPAGTPATGASVAAPPAAPAPAEAPAPAPAEPPAPWEPAGTTAEQRANTTRIRAKWLHDGDTLYLADGSRATVSKPGGEFGPAILRSDRHGTVELDENRILSILSAFRGGREVTADLHTTSVGTDLHTARERQEMADRIAKRLPGIGVMVYSEENSAAIDRILAEAYKGDTEGRRKLENSFKEFQKSGKAFFDPTSKTIFIGPGADFSSVPHEVFHGILHWSETHARGLHQQLTAMLENPPAAALAWAQEHYAGKPRAILLEEACAELWGRRIAEAVSAEQRRENDRLVDNLAQDGLTWWGRVCELCTRILQRFVAHVPEENRGRAAGGARIDLDSLEALARTSPQEAARTLYDAIFSGTGIDWQGTEWTQPGPTSAEKGPSSAGEGTKPAPAAPSAGLSSGSSQGNLFPSSAPAPSPSPSAPIAEPSFHAVRIAGNVARIPDSPMGWLDPAIHAGTVRQEASRRSLKGATPATPLAKVRQLLQAQDKRRENGQALLERTRNRSFNDPLLEHLFGGGRKIRVPSSIAFERDRNKVPGAPKIGGEWDGFERALFPGLGDKFVPVISGWDHIDSIAQEARHVLQGGGDWTADSDADYTMDDFWQDLARACKNEAEYKEHAKQDELEAKQYERFEKDALSARPGTTPVPVESLEGGDKLNVNGVELKVENVTPDGTVTLSDGNRYGEQVVQDGQTLHAEVVSTRAENEAAEKAGLPDRAALAAMSKPQLAEQMRHEGLSAPDARSLAMAKKPDLLSRILSARRRNGIAQPEEAAGGDDVPFQRGATPGGIRWQAGGMLESIQYEMEDNGTEPSVDSLLDEWDNARAEGAPRKDWPLIPADQYRNALRRFMRDGDRFVFPERILRGWLRLCTKNLMEMSVITGMAGHDTWDATPEIEDHYNGDTADFDLDAFIDWARLPEGSTSVSDYGLAPIYKILDELDENATSGQMIVALNRILDVMHMNGDLSAAFIEGGSKTLSRISNDRTPLFQRGAPSAPARDWSSATIPELRRELVRRNLSPSGSAAALRRRLEEADRDRDAIRWQTGVPAAPFRLEQQTPGQIAAEAAAAKRLQKQQEAERAREAAREAKAEAGRRQQFDDLNQGLLDIGLPGETGSLFAPRQRTGGTGTLFQRGTPFAPAAPARDWSRATIPEMRRELAARGLPATGDATRLRLRLTGADRRGTLDTGNDPDNGIRFQADRTIERRKDLVAFHNVSAAGLKGMDSLGGMAMPSFSITKDTIGGDEFGEISLLVHPRTIDPRKPGNAIFTNDAWTPTFPKTVLKVDGKKSGAIYSRIIKLFRDPKNTGWDKVAQGWSADAHPDNVDDAVQRANGDAVQALRDNTTFRIAFALESGRAPELAMEDVPLFMDSNGLLAWADNSILPAVSERLGDRLVHDGHSLSFEEAQELSNDRSFMEELAGIVETSDRYRAVNGKPDGNLVAMVKSGEVSDFSLFRNIRDLADTLSAWRQRGIPREPDRGAAMRSVDEAIAAAPGAYEQWLRGLTDGLTNGKRYVRNDREPFTPDGHSLPFSKLYDELTLATAVKAMRKQQDPRGGGIFGRNPFGVAARRYPSLKAVIADEARLQPKDMEKAEALHKELIDRFSGLAAELANTYTGGEKNGLVVHGRASDALMEEWVNARGNKPAVLEGIRQWYGYRPTAEMVDELADIMRAMSSMPEDYFEAKAYRAVGFDEVVAALVPDNASRETRDILSRNGIATLDYKAGDAADRLAKLNEAADSARIKFQRGAPAAPSADWATATIPELRRELVRRGLSPSGSAAALRRRLEEADRRQAEAEDGGIRWQKASPTDARRLEGAPKVRVYRAMQMVDGKLYPPMAAKVGGKWVDPTEPGTWYVADEHPELAMPVIDKKTGKQKVDRETGRPVFAFKLDKGNSSSITAAYNPYWHTSRTPLNDQFSSASKRPELVIVECEVPESELSSGYRAEKAKDTVGEKDWHSGPVSSWLAEHGQRRKVILSRYSKVVRVVPDAEVAAEVRRMLDGTDISIPESVVTPALRAELERLGVDISRQARSAYSWDKLAKDGGKPRTMAVPRFTRGAFAQHTPRKDMVESARKSVRQAGGRDTPGGLVLDIPAFGEVVVIGRSGIEHGLHYRTRNGGIFDQKNADILPSLGAILKNSVPVNELMARPKDPKGVTGATVLLGAAMDDAGALVPVVSVVDHVRHEKPGLPEIRVFPLKSVNAKNPQRATGLPPDAPSAGFSEINLVHSPP